MKNEILEKEYDVEEFTAIIDMGGVERRSTHESLERDHELYSFCTSRKIEVPASIARLASNPDYLWQIKAQVVRPEQLTYRADDLEDIVDPKSHHIPQQKFQTLSRFPEAVASSSSRLSSK